MLWVKLNKVDGDLSCIYMPQHIARNLSSNSIIEFGVNKVKVFIQPSDDSSVVEECSFENPIIIKCSKDIIEKLLIIDSIVYQMTYEMDVIKIGPLIGFFLGEQCFYYHDRNMSGFNRGMEVYPYIGGLFVAFKDISIDKDNRKVYGLYYHYAENKWKYGILPMPSVVFCRAFDNKQSTIDKLKRITGKRVFNSARLDKWQLYNMLKTKVDFSKYLVPTECIDKVAAFHEYIHKYSKVILKPSGLSRGRGICFIHKVEDYYTVYDYRISNTPRFHMVEEDKIENFLTLNNLINESYIIQPHVQFASINGSPFDIRIVMGKDCDGAWNCRGIECRLAGPKNIITNISRGGQALHISDALRLAYGPGIASDKIKKTLISIAKDLCAIMDDTGEHYAEFGLDFAMDGNKNYWFIEANVRPVFRGFKRLSYNNYLHIRHSPLLYAASLAGFGRKVKDNGKKI